MTIIKWLAYANKWFFNAAKDNLKEQKEAKHQWDFPKQFHKQQGTTLGNWETNATK